MSQEFQTEQRELYDDSPQAVIADDTTTTVSELTMEETVEILVSQHPELSDTIATILEGDSSITSTELIEQLSENLESDSDNEAETITVTTNMGSLYFDDLRDIAFTASLQIRIQMTMNGSTVLDNIYQPSFDGLVHLDLQDLVRANTLIYLPTVCPEESAIIDGIVHQFYAHSWIYVTVTQYDNTKTCYQFRVYAYSRKEDGLRSDIDFLRVPKDYLLPFSVEAAPILQKYGTFRAFLESPARKLLLNSGTIATADDEGEDYDACYLLSQDIPMSLIPYRPDETFRIRLSLSGQYPSVSGNSISQRRFSKLFSTPLLKVVNGQFEQYLFLNKYGSYDNIPMSGAKSFVPEYDIENANRSYSIEKVHSTKKELYTQNTGPLSRATLQALSELFLSPEIFHYIPGKSLRRIVVENPTLTINSKNSINSATFSWRYAGK